MSDCGEGSNHNIKQKDMILETMTLAEITKELQQDLKEIIDKSWDRLDDDYRRIRRRRKVPKTATFEVFFEIKSARKNNWIFKFSKPPSDERFTNNTAIDICPLSYYYNKAGLRVFRFGCDDTHHGVFQNTVYNGHFFKRYNERMGLNIVNPIEIVKAFIRKNSYSMTKRVPKDGRCFSIGVCRDGIILGEIQGSWEIYKTFITRDLTWADQNELEKSMLNDLEQDIKKELFLPIMRHLKRDLKCVKDVYYSICA
jgi:hypothetical protein